MVTPQISGQNKINFSIFEKHYSFCSTPNFTVAFTQSIMGNIGAIGWLSNYRTGYFDYSHYFQSIFALSCCIDWVPVGNHNRLVN